MLYINEKKKFYIFIDGVFFYIGNWSENKDVF